MEYARNVILKVKTKNKYSFKKYIEWIKQNILVFFIINIVLILMIIDIVMIKIFMSTLRVL